MRNDVQRKVQYRRVNAAQQALYNDLEKESHMESAVEAFRRKPYCINTNPRKIHRKTVASE